MDPKVTSPLMHSNSTLSIDSLNFQHELRCQGYSIYLRLVEANFDGMYTFPLFGTIFQIEIILSEKFKSIKIIICIVLQQN